MDTFPTFSSVSIGDLEQVNVNWKTNVSTFVLLNFVVKMKKVLLRKLIQNKESGNPKHNKNRKELV